MGNYGDDYRSRLERALSSASGSLYRAAQLADERNDLSLYSDLSLIRDMVVQLLELSASGRTHRPLSGQLVLPTS